MTREQFISHVEGTQKAFRSFLVALCCGDSALADDIAQESYIKAYLSCDGLENPQKFKAWIFRIGYNAFLSHKRAEKKYADYEEAANIVSEEETDSKYRYQDLYMALNGLTNMERSSILLFYKEDYSIKEIAEIEGTSVEAVKQHLSRGRKHLKILLSNQ